MAFKDVDGWRVSSDGPIQFQICMCRATEGTNGQYNQNNSLYMMEEVENAGDTE